MDILLEIRLFYHRLLPKPLHQILTMLRKNYRRTIWNAGQKNFKLYWQNQ